MILINTVLVATDFGKVSEAALTYGRDLARTFGANLRVLHVVDNVVARAASEFYPTGPGDLQKDLEVSAERYLDRLVTDDDRTRLSAKSVVVVSASPADAIVDYAKRTHVDIIVVGTHGRGPVSHLFLGSVAEKIVRHAPCPVLVVRPNEHEFVVPDAVPVAAVARV
jgi:nucleotide-binding universal stress UspA family protein